MAAENDGFFIYSQSCFRGKVVHGFVNWLISDTEIIMIILKQYSYADIIGNTLTYTGNIF